MQLSEESVRRRNEQESEELTDKKISVFYETNQADKQSEELTDRSEREARIKSARNLDAIRQGSETRLRMF